jgi:hypothetical protein
MSTERTIFNITVIAVVNLTREGKPITAESIAAELRTLVVFEPDSAYDVAAQGFVAVSEEAGIPPHIAALLSYPTARAELRAAQAAGKLPRAAAPHDPAEKELERRVERGEGQAEAAAAIARLMAMGRPTDPKDVN